MGELDIIVSVAFWGSFILSFLILLYARKVSKRLGGKGFLNKVVILVGISAFIFGIHHVMETLIGGIPIGLVIAEGFESFAALILLYAVYVLYKM